jgi:hypothetical protein
MKHIQAEKMPVQVNTPLNFVGKFLPYILSLFLQKILSSTLHINKSVEYEAFVPWLGDNLFLEKGNLL